MQRMPVLNEEDVDRTRGEREQLFMRIHSSSKTLSEESKGGVLNVPEEGVREPSKEDLTQT